MSSKDTAVNMAEARRLAIDKVRSSYGTFIRLDDGEYIESENEFQFTIHIRRPRVIHESSGESIMDLRFHPRQDLGTLTVDGETREVDSPHREKLFKKIREQEASIEEAIRKALVSVAGTKLSHLPFLENQFAPLEDLIAELILNEGIDRRLINRRDEERGGSSYADYVDDLIESDLANLRGGRITAGGRLIRLKEKNKERYQATLNDAMGVYFQDHLDQFELINKTLGPYLVIAGRYYERALEMGETPVIREQELRDAIISEYTGKRQRRSLFKFSHYLIQLQEVGVLEPTIENGERCWKGDDSVRKNLQEQANVFKPIQDILPNYGQA